MELGDLGKQLGNMGLKLLGSAMGGSAGESVAELAAHALGLESAEPDKISDAIAKNPDAALKLKELELNNEVELKRIVLEEARLRLADVASARQREVEITKATGRKDLNLYILAWVIMGGFIGLIGAMIICQYAFGKTLESDPLISLLVGSLSTDAGMVVGYFFGSSKSSADKNALLAQAQSTSSGGK